MTSHPPPVASVLIPSRNRKQMLHDTLVTILAQSVPVEIIIMDDASTDGTTDFITSAFPSDQYPVRVIRHEQSAGPTTRRNQAADLATTPFLFTIDDDCQFPSKLTIEQTLAGFDHPRIGAVTIPYINVLQNTNVNFRTPDDKERYIGFMFYGGMVAFRKSAYQFVKGYRTYYFMHVEEPDLSIRLMNAGYVLRLGFADPIHHLESPIRNKIKLHVLGPRNHLLYHWYNTPMPSFAFRAPITAVACFWWTIKLRRPDLGVWGLLRGIRGILHEWYKRNPVGSQLFRLTRMLNVAPQPLSKIEPLLPPLTGPVD